MILCALFSFLMAAVLVLVHSGPWKFVWIGGSGLLWFVAGPASLAIAIVLGLVGVALLPKHASA